MPPTLLLLACVRDDGSGSGNTYTGPGPSYIDTAVSHDTDTDSDTDSDTDADADADTDTDTDADADADTDTAPDTALILASGCPPDTATTTWRDTAAVIDTASDGSRDWAGVYADTFATCGLTTDGAIQCWGTASGDNDTGPPEGTFVSMAIARDPGDWRDDQHACGIHDDGTIECWGLNDNGQTDAPEGTFTQVVVGDSASCALGMDGTISCWGDSRSYSGSSWTQIAMGGYVFAAMNATGELFVWMGYDGARNVYQVVGTYTTVTAYAGVCATASDGAVTCWGSGCWSVPPAPHAQLSSVCLTSDMYGCGLNASGYPVCWSNHTYQPGILEEPARPFTSLSCGFNYVCGVALDGAIICWGPDEDYYGNLSAP